MVGKRKPQSLFDVGNVFPVALQPDTFYGQLAVVADQLFDDDHFVDFYVQGKGRPSVPPSLLALVMLMQTQEGVSDAEAIERSCFDLRWAAVLRREAGTPLCAKSTLQLFRAHLLLHDKLGLLLRSSLDEARRNGLLQGKHLRAAVDTKPMLGQGAVEDTYNLLATGMRQLARAIAQSRGQKLDAFVKKHGLESLTTPSIKGSVDIDWSDCDARSAFLTGLVSEAKRLMKMADANDERIKESAGLLEQLLLQDVEEKPDTDGTLRAHIKDGTPKGRIPSATDPEQRHGRKSKSKRFTGFKSSVAVDSESSLVLAVDVLPGDAGDATDLLQLVHEAEANSGCAIDETLGDCAYGGGATRQQFKDAGRELRAKVPAESDSGAVFPKSAFDIELPQSGESFALAVVTCPGNQVAERATAHSDGAATFYFDGKCTGCSYREICTSSQTGRSLRVHAQEDLLQQARTFQNSPEGRAVLRKRLVVENALARLSHLGIGQGRYKGREKSRFQLTLAATVANLRRTWNWAARQIQKGTNNRSLRPA